MQRDRRLAERLAIRLDHGVAELPELPGQNSLGSLDRFGRLRGGFLQRIRKDFLLVRRQLVPDVTAITVTIDSVMWPVSTMWLCTS